MRFLIFIFFSSSFPDLDLEFYKPISLSSLKLGKEKFELYSEEYRKRTLMNIERHRLSVVFIRSKHDRSLWLSLSLFATIHSSFERVRLVRYDQVSPAMLNGTSREDLEARRERLISRRLFITWFSGVTWTSRCSLFLYREPWRHALVQASYEQCRNAISHESVSINNIAIPFMRARHFVALFIQDLSPRRSINLPHRDWFTPASRKLLWSSRRSWSWSRESQLATALTRWHPTLLRLSKYGRECCGGFKSTYSALSSCNSSCNIGAFDRKFTYVNQSIRSAAALCAE